MAKEMKYRHYLHGGDYNPEQWLDRPDILQKDIEYFKKAHINTVSVGIFSWAVLEPEEGKYNFDWLEEIINNLYKEGIYTILATPSGARPKWMADKYEEVLRMDPDRTRRFFGGRHNHCFTSPVYREKVHAIDKKLAERFGKHPAVMLWHISNEFGGECHCPLCQAKFREWLKEKYGTIENLNKRWCTTFWSHIYNSFDQIESPSTKGENELHALKLDWKRFVTDQTIDFIKNEVDAIREGGSELPVTANLMYDYDGLDYKKFKDVLDIVSWDNYPGWHKKEEYLTAVDAEMQHDLMRSIRKEPFLLMESCPASPNWQKVSKAKHPGLLMNASLQAIAHGSDSAQFFQIRASRGSFEKFHGAVIDHYGGDDTRIFREVTDTGIALQTLTAADVPASSVHAPAAVLYDMESRWAMEDAKGPRNEGLFYHEAALKSYQAFRKNGLNTDIINMDQDLTGYQIIAAPMLYMFRSGIEQKLRTFVQNGGILIMTYWSGIVNETDLCHLGGTPHHLIDVLGIRSEEIDGLYDNQCNHMVPASNNFMTLPATYLCTHLCDLVQLKGAVPLMQYADNFYAGYPALTVHKYGDGLAFYLCADAEDTFYYDFYRQIIQEQELPVIMDHIPEGIEVSSRSSGRQEFIFAQNYTDSPIPFTLPGHAQILFGQYDGTIKEYSTLIYQMEVKS